MKNHFLFYCFLGIVLLFRVQPMEAQELEASLIDSLVIPETKVGLLYEVRPSQYITGAVSYISGEEVANVPGVNRLNVLAGRMTGISFTEVDGLPGVENSTFKIRGEHTFRGSIGAATRTPLVLIDGRVDDYTLVDPYDIESVVFLKDAASLAMYGLRSANGIIMINTKKGNVGRNVISVNMETSFSQPTRLPKFLDSYNYAQLYNEAQLNDNPNATPKYSASDLEGYRSGSDPYRYPNVNWADEFMKKNYVTTRTNISLRGGNETAQYYVAANYLYNSGVFNVDKDVNTYNTNSDAKVMNIHTNLKLNIGRNLKFDADIRGKKDVRNQPLPYSLNFATDMINHLYSLPFNAHPITNRDGSIAGTNDYRLNPYGILNYWGYSILERSSISSYLNVSYDLSDFAKGLSIVTRFGFNTYTDYSISRNKNFAVYQYNYDTNEYDQFGADTGLGNGGDYRYIFRNFDHNIGLKYTGDFGKHHIDALLMYDRQQVVNARVADFTKNFQGPKGSLSYRYNNTYLVDFVFSYQGSEQYPKENRYGFFPAVSAGWIISNESFMANSNFFDLLKIRGSYGLTGNHIDTYFAYLETFGGGTAYIFGTTPGSQAGSTQTRIANPILTWEKCLKTNVGLDFALLGNRLSGSFDYFSEKTRDILVQDAITTMFGATGVYTPTGKFENKGYEIQLEWRDRIQDFTYFIGGNFSVAENKIVYMNEQLRAYPWMYETGNPVNSRYGYVYDRFFTESDNIASLPNQSIIGSQQKPGDLKYQDLNSDGVIDENDRQFIGNPALPHTSYGINFGVGFKGFDANVLFHGTQGGTKYVYGVTYWDFNSRTGNVLEHHLDRWQPGDGQSAGYPRLSLDNNNNYNANTYWIRDNSFIRLKFVELGYTLPVHISQKAGMSRARIFLNGNNLFVWDKIGVNDPELLDSGLAFPIQRTINVGLNISF